MSDVAPDFEGEAVGTTKAKITSVAGLEIGDRVFHLDDSVKMVIEARVAGVSHQMDAAGRIERVHIMRAIDSVVVDWSLDLDALREDNASG